MIKRLLLTSLTTVALSTTLLNADTSEVFITTTLGYTHQNVEQTDKVGSIILANDLKEDGYNFEIGAGYFLTKEVALSLNYQRVLQDSTYENNTYLSAEYAFVNSSEFTPYLGVNAGYSQLNYSKEPMNTTDNDYISGSWLVGATLGVSYTLTKNIDFIGEYTLNVTDHTTLLESGTAKSELTHNYAHNLNLGFRVCF